jgi:hypothetical protein
MIFKCSAFWVQLKFHALSSGLYPQHNSHGSLGNIVEMICKYLEIFQVWRGRLTNKPSAVNIVLLRYSEIIQLHICIVSLSAFQHCDH